MRKNANTATHLDDNLGSGDRRLPNEEESSVEPTPIVDKVEDIIQELIHPEKLSPVAICKLTSFVNEMQVSAGDAGPEIRERIRRIINHLRPTRAELVNRWAFSFASEDPDIQNLPQSFVAEMLGLDKASMSRAVKKWREILNYDNRASTKSNAMHLRSRTLRHRAQQQST